MPITEVEKPPRLNIAAGIIYNADRSGILIACRPQGREQAGRWEFPGGKLETGESPAQALRRELREEINIEVIADFRLLEYDHDYERTKVRLFIHEVTKWRGEVRPKERQRLRWVAVRELPSVNMLAGNRLIIDTLLSQ